jgi:hypothetical protein
MAQVPSHGTKPANPHGAMGAGSMGAGASPHAGMQGGMPGHGMTSKRAEMAKECGITDASLEKGTTLTQRANGSWNQVKTDADAKATDTGMARIWHEKAWFVDMQETGATGDTMHITRMCFRPDGTIVKSSDQYMAPNKCGCTRITETTYEGGKPVKREQNFYKIANHEKIEAPKDAASYPRVPEFKKFEQAPFYGLVKK